MQHSQKDETELADKDMVIDLLETYLRILLLLVEIIMVAIPYGYMIMLMVQKKISFENAQSRLFILVVSFIIWASTVSLYILTVLLR